MDFLTDGGVTPENLPADLRERLRAIYNQLRLLLVFAIGVPIVALVAAVVVGFVLNPWAGALLIVVVAWWVTDTVKEGLEEKSAAADEIFREARCRLGHAED